MINPSTIGGRGTYVTGGQNGGVLNGGVPLGNGSQPGFELISLISPEACLLPFFAFAFLETAPIGLYLLLLDQKQSADQSNATPGRPKLVMDGDLALLTLGPTIATGSTGVFSESETEAKSDVAVATPDGRGRVERMIAGFPFDRGCIAVVSSTPGRVTQIPTIDNPPVGIVRVTARVQRCG